MLSYVDIKRIFVLLRDDIKSAKTKKKLHKLNKVLKYFTSQVLESRIYNTRSKNLVKKEYKKTFKLLYEKYKNL